MTYFLTGKSHIKKIKKIKWLQLKFFQFKTMRANLGTGTSQCMPFPGPFPLFQPCRRISQFFVYSPSKKERLTPNAQLRTRHTRKPILILPFPDMSVQGECPRQFQQLPALSVKIKTVVKALYVIGSSQQSEMLAQYTIHAIIPKTGLLAKKRHSTCLRNPIIYRLLRFRHWFEAKFSLLFYRQREKNKLQEKTGL